MTFQPPPSPPGGTPPPPPPSGPPGQWGPPPGGGGFQQAGGGAFDPKSVNPLDWGILGAGVLAFIFSLFDYYTVSYSSGGFSTSISASAWHGFFGWFAALLALVGAALVAAAIFAPQVKLPVPARLAGLGAFALATLCVILALFIIPDGGAGDVPGIDDGHGFGYWASLVLIIAGLVLSLMRFQQSGGQLPGGLSSKMPNIGQHGPQGGIGSGSQGGYGSGSQGGYGSAPQAGSAPQPGYGSAPQPGYGSAPQPGYGSAPQPGYGSAPQPGYGSAPQPGYGSAPQPGVGAPPPPPPGYGPPAGQ
jgi:hypothetical protein